MHSRGEGGTHGMNPGGKSGTGCRVPYPCTASRNTCDDGAKFVPCCYTDWSGGNAGENTGSGGGGAAQYNGQGGSGGSGIVIVRYAYTPPE